MKKFIIMLIMLFLFANYSMAFEDIYVEERPLQIPQIEETIKKEPEQIIFNWGDLSEQERIHQAQLYKNMIFDDSSDIYYTKTTFKKAFAKYKKDKEYKHHYMLTNNGVTQDQDARYSPFYFKRNTLIIYAIQYKNDIYNSLYYTAYGKLHYVDITSKNYPEFPYYSMQYDRNGNLKSAIYFVSSDIQYMYNGTGVFQGVWYKNQMFDIKNKQVSTREGW